MMKDILQNIKKCFQSGKVLYTKHARQEMLNEELSEVSEEEVSEAVINGLIIMNYPEDKPYPSCLINGKTKNDRPIHIVAAYDKGNDTTFIITIYQPNPNLWIDYERKIR
jgi:hypothetical protein